ncbi:hypothetical protein ABZP36_004317 [Zizania latifolia]
MGSWAGQIWGVLASQVTVTLLFGIFAVFLWALIQSYAFQMYGCSLFTWKSTRISHNFIFDFSSSTALTHWDAFLMSASIMCTVVGALVINLFLKNAGVSYANALPGALLLLSTGVLLCPFDIFYCLTRYCFMRVIRNIIFSPFYKHTQFGMPIKGRVVTLFSKICDSFSSPYRAKIDQQFNLTVLSSTRK